MNSNIKVPACFGANDYGFAATGFAKSAILRQLGFSIGVAVMRDSNPARQKTVMDKATLEALGENDNGQTKPVVLDVDNLAMGYAAAFRLLRNHTKLTNPESGKADEHLLKFLVKPSDHIERAANYSRDQNAAGNIATLKANAALLFAKRDDKGNITNQAEIDEKCAVRIAAIQAEAATSVTVNATPTDALFHGYLTANKDESTENLLATALDALVKAGNDPTTVIKRASDAYADAMRKRVEGGLFVKVDAGIIALAQMS